MKMAIDTSPEAVERFADNLKCLKVYPKTARLTEHVKITTYGIKGTVDLLYALSTELEAEKKKMSELEAMYDASRSVNTTAYEAGYDACLERHQAQLSEARNAVLEEAKAAVWGGGGDYLTLAAASDRIIALKTPSPQPSQEKSND